jgi:hypothetical protein
MESSSEAEHPSWCLCVPPALEIIIVTRLASGRSLTHLGTLNGHGSLLIKDGEELGSVSYEIDGYLDRTVRWANGQIEGEGGALCEAFGAGDAAIVLESGRLIHVVLSNPRGGPTAEIEVSGHFPL